MPEWIERFGGRLEVSAPLTDQQLSEIPAKRGIFALLGEDEAAIVLLTGANIRSRLRNRLSEPLEGRRKKTIDLRSVTRKIIWRLTSSHFETDLEFLEAAARMWCDSYADLLGWSPAWFVHVDPQSAYPHFARTRDLAKAPPSCVGPFPTARSVGNFISALQDTFELCRDVRCLRSSPNGPRCAYGQMNRCLCPCDGTISMDDYRRAISEAADFAGGSRERLTRRLNEQMAAAAKNLQFELAGALKTRLDRLTEFESRDYTCVAPVEEFRYLLVQPAQTARKAKVFFVKGGSIAKGGDLDYPLKRPQLQKTLERMTLHAEGAGLTDRLSVYRMGLVARYLFSSDRKRGLILRWSAGMVPEDLARAIDQTKEHLKLRTPKPRKRKGAAGKASK